MLTYEMNFWRLNKSVGKPQHARCCVCMCDSVMATAHLGVLTQHVEPEDRCPGTLLLAGVRNDDHWK